MKASLRMKLSLILLTGLFWSGGHISVSWAQDVIPSATPSSESGSKVLFAVRPAGALDKSFFDNVEIQPGGFLDLDMVVLNWGEVAVDLRVYKANASNPVNGGFEVGQESDTPTTLTSWIEFPEREVHLPPKTEIVMAFRVNVPTDAEPGQYISSMVAATTDTLPIPGSETIDHRLRFSMAVSIIVPGELSHSFELGDPTLNGSRLSVPIANTGNYLVKPVGSLILTDQFGVESLTAEVRLDAIYGGNKTHLEVSLPEQFAPGDYTVAIELADPASGFTAGFDGKPIIIDQPETPRALVVTEVSIQPNNVEIVFSNVSVTVENEGAQLPATDVILQVLHGGELIDEYPLARNQVLVRGDNEFTTRYIPVGEWESGTYTFRVVVHSVDPNGGQQIELLNEDLDAEIVVP